jgi:hypothetical protein
MNHENGYVLLPSGTIITVDNSLMALQENLNTVGGPYCTKIQQQLAGAEAKIEAIKEVIVTMAEINNLELDTNARISDQLSKCFSQLIVQGDKLRHENSDLKDLIHRVQGLTQEAVGIRDRAAIDDQ